MTTPLPPLTEIQLTLVNDVDTAGDFMRWLGERHAGIVAFDTETSGLRPEREVLRLVQIGDAVHGWAIPWQLWGGVAVEALTKYDGELAAHNSSFDARFLQLHAGWYAPWDRLHDTMTMSHLDSPTRPKGLKPLAARLVDRNATAGQQALHEVMTAQQWTWATVPVDLPEYWVYGALDPVLTSRVHSKLAPSVLSTYREAYELEMSALRVLTKMMLKGARIDPAYCEQKVTHLRQWAGTARDWLRQEYQLKNATSNVQIIDALQRTGVTLTACTKGEDCVDPCPYGHQRSVDKHVLEPLALAGHPVAKYVVAVRQAEKLCGSYLEHFLAWADDAGRVHPNINALGTKTSRMSITEPALQTLPRRDPTVRNAIVPSDGHVIVACDSDQIEARLMAHFSQDAGLIAAFAAEGDFFCSVAGEIWHSKISKADPRRQLTKNTVYGKQYGAGVDKMAKTAGVPFEQMEPVVKSFDARFPGVANFMRAVERVASQRYRDEGEAYVTSPTGRRFVAEDPQKLYVLVNYLLQGHAAEVLKHSIIEADSLGLGDYLELPVHDELVADVPAESAEEAIRLLERAMTKTSGYAVPLTASAELFPERWGPKS